MISLLFTILVLAVICVLVFWVVSVAGLPEPIGKILQVVVVVVVCIYLISLLLPYAGGNLSLR